MGRSSLTYIPGFSVNFFFQPIYTLLKSSSLCLYSSNLGTFWLKIEQFWPFEEISIFSNGGHLGYRMALTDTNFKRDQPRDHPCQDKHNDELFSKYYRIFYEL
jgi:hypothetical protein